MAVKAVIDTNVWVSSLLNPFGFPARLRKSFEAGAFQAVISESILEELASEHTIKELLILIEEKAEHVFLSGDITICRDKDDNLVIETAIKGQAAFLVTRDDDIKFSKEVCSFLLKKGVSVISIAKFLALINKT